MSKCKPKGILYQKYHNTITKLRKHDLWSCPKKSDIKRKTTLTNFDQPLSTFPEIDGKKFKF